MEEPRPFPFSRSAEQAKWMAFISALSEEERLPAGPESLEVVPSGKLMNTPLPPFRTDSCAEPSVQNIGGRWAKRIKEVFRLKALLGVPCSAQELSY